MDELMNRRMMLGAAGLVGAAAMARIAQAGSLDPPPGPISPTPGPEPRTPINGDMCPGDGSAVYTIAQSGSYSLAGNVDAAPGLGGINVTASNVTIDLMGFTVDVAAGMTGIGAPVGVDHVRITNGVVKAGLFGVQLQGRGSSVERVCATGCDTGILIVEGDLTMCRAVACITAGIDAQFATLIGCCAAHCTFAGFNTNFGCSVDSCVAQTCGDFGFRALRTTLVNCSACSCASGFLLFASSATGCQATGSEGYGFDLTQSTARQCRALGLPNSIGFTVSQTGSRVEECEAQSVAIGFYLLGISGNVMNRNVAHSCQYGFDIPGSAKGGIGEIFNATADRVFMTTNSINLIV